MSLSDLAPPLARRAEAVLMALMAKALKGDVRAAESLLRLMQQYLPSDDETDPVLAAKPQEIVVEFVKAAGRPEPADSG